MASQSETDRWRQQELALTAVEHRLQALGEYLAVYRASYASSGEGRHYARVPLACLVVVPACHPQGGVLVASVAPFGGLAGDVCQSSSAGWTAAPFFRDVASSHQSQPD